MAVQTRTFTGQDDFGFVNREDDSTFCAGGNRGFCQLVDEAAVYYTKSSPAQRAEIRRVYSAGSPFFAGENLPPGVIPDFYRLALAREFFDEFGKGTPSLRQLVGVLQLTNEERGREDDYAKLRAAVKAVSGVCDQVPVAGQPSGCSLAEKSWVAERRSAIQRVNTGGGGGKGGGFVIPVGLLALLALL